MPESQTWTIGDLLKWTTEFFQKQGIESPRLDAEVLLAAARECERIDLYAAFKEPAEERVRVAFRELVRRRADGAPVAYLVGRREFYSMSLRVTPDVLIPRPETESLVVVALDRVKALRAGGLRDREMAIADVGTGSGAIAIAIARHAAPCRVAAIDISPAAIAIAKENAASLGADGAIDFYEGDLFASLPPERRFDVIVSNPPYVAEHEFETLPRDVRDYEPRGALVAGEEGVDVIKRLLAESRERLNDGGALLMEISPMIADKVESLITSDTNWTAPTRHRDMAGRDRVIETCKKRP